MMRNAVFFSLSVAAYHLYVVNLFFSLPHAWAIEINFLGVPIICGAIIFLLYVGDVWVRIVLTASVPIAPMAFAGNFVDTGGINIAYIGPLMAAFAAGAGIAHLATLALRRL